jgi:hypothetical protein
VLQNKNNKSNYFTSFLVGSNNEEVKLGFDMMKSLSVINAQNCFGCNHKANIGFEY